MTRVLASWFDDKIGCRDNNLYDGGMYYAELSKDYTKKPQTSRTILTNNKIEQI